MNDETFDQIITRIKTLRSIYAENGEEWWEAAKEKQDSSFVLLSGLASAIAADLENLRDYVESLRTEAEEAPEKPWYDAEPGEVWVITFENEKLYALVDEDCDFVISDETAGRSWVSMRHTAITAGHRVLEAL